MPLFSEVNLVVTPDQLERLGKLADSCDNYVAASMLPLPDRLHVEQLRAGLTDLGAQIRALYVEITGENPWDEGDANAPT